MNYTITLTDNQLKTVGNALEMWERMMMGQFFDYVDEIAKNGFIYNRQDPDNRKKFDAYIERRNMALYTLEHGFDLAQPNRQPKTNEMMISEDIWMAIRHKLWEDAKQENKHDYCMGDRVPLGISQEPIPKIERLETKK